MDSSSLTFHSLIAERWPDLEKLFGQRGACGGCWCMWWRLKRSIYEAQKGDGNRQSFKQIVARGDEPGILAYLGGDPVGWCAIGPRETYPVLARSRILQPVDQQPVWSIVCLFNAQPFRRQGLTVPLIKAAVVHACERGARIIEAYPVEPKKAEMPPIFAATGFASAFRQAGFVEVLRRSETRPMMRYFSR